MKKLVFFDFDYTIAKTYETVRLWSPRGTRAVNNRSYTPLTPREYNNVQIANDEFIDETSFEEFKKVDLDRATKLESICFLFESYSFMGHTVKVLSARPQIAEKYIHDFIRKNNMYFNKELQFKGCGSSLPELKYSYIKKCIGDGDYKNIIIFDDSKKVIDYVTKKIEQEYDSSKLLTTCLVELCGQEEVLRYKKTNGKKKINEAML